MYKIMTVQEKSQILQSKIIENESNEQKLFSCFTLRPDDWMCLVY